MSPAGHRASHITEEERERLPGGAAVRETLTAELADLRELPYRVEHLDLVDAGRRKIESFSGNCIVILSLVGHEPEIRIRIGGESKPAIPVTALGNIPLAYEYVLIEWDAIAGGAADLLFCTVAT